MQKVLSTRLPEEVINEMEEASRRLGITKKQFLEEAIHLRAAQDERGRDVWAETAGAWKRDETPEETIDAIKESFRKSWGRYRDLGRD